MKKPDIYDMDLKVLIELIKQNSDLDIKKLSKKLTQYSLGNLLVRWHNEQNQTLKELLEIAIAEQYNNKPIISIDEFNINLLNKYLENVSSLDAIYKLMQTPDRNISQKASLKYQEFLNKYLDMIDKNENIQKLYEEEGDDSLVINTKDNIVSFEIPKDKRKNEKRKIKKQENLSIKNREE